MNRPNNSLLTDLKAFAIELANATVLPKGTPHVSTTMFGTTEYGGLAFSGEEELRYYKIIAGLLSGMDQAMSEASVRTLVQTALLKTIDIKKLNQSQSIDVRASKAVEEVRRALSSPRLKWVSCIPILGLKPPKRAWKLGNVVLVDIVRKEGKAFLKDAEHITDRTTNTKEEKAAAKAHTRKELIDDHPGQTFALVTTMAFDAEAPESKEPSSQSPRPPQ